jgi:hypothetical protein
MDDRRASVGNDLLKDLTTRALGKKAVVFCLGGRTRPEPLTAARLGGFPKERRGDQELETAQDCRCRDLRAPLLRGGWLLFEPNLDGSHVGPVSRSPLHDAVLWRPQISDVASSAVVISNKTAPVAAAPSTCSSDQNAPTLAKNPPVRASCKFFQDPQNTRLISIVAHPSGRRLGGLGDGGGRRCAFTTPCGAPRHG